MSQKSSDSYSPQESKERFEAALRGARLAGHKPMSAVKADNKKKGKAKAKKPAK